MVIESNIDDMTGEVAGYVMSKLLDAGALDVFYTPIYMKKNRPAVKLSVICSHEGLETMENIILSETTTIGIRKYKTERICMNREIINVPTPYGDAAVKVSSLREIKKYIPEYEDCKKLAKAAGVPLRDIYDLVVSIAKKLC